MTVLTQSCKRDTTLLRCKTWGRGAIWRDGVLILFRNPLSQVSSCGKEKKSEGVTRIYTQSKKKGVSGVKPNL